MVSELIFIGSVLSRIRRLIEHSAQFGNGL